jgi:Flp pilus assembly secretin CpaC
MNTANPSQAAASAPQRGPGSHALKPSQACVQATEVHAPQFPQGQLPPCPTVPSARWGSLTGLFVCLGWSAFALAPSQAGVAEPMPRWISRTNVGFQGPRADDARATRDAFALANPEQARSAREANAGLESGALFQTRASSPSLTAIPIPTPSRARFMAPTASLPVVASQPRAAAPLMQARTARSVAASASVARRPVKRAAAARPLAAQPSAKTAAARTAGRRLAQAAPEPSRALPPAEVRDLTVSELPAARVAPPSLPALSQRSSSDAAGLGAMRKVIQVSALKLPASTLLPEKYRAVAISADALLARGAARSGARGSARGLRAQNSDLPPLRPAQPVTNSDRLPNQIEVAVSTFVVLLTTTDLQTVAVADPAIADVAVINSRAVLVNGKAPGVTSLVVVDRTKIRQYQVRVTSAPGRTPADVASQIALPGVTVRGVNDALVLEGEVANAEESRRAAEVAAAYSPKVINQIVVRGAVGPEAGLATQVQNTIDLPNVRVRAVGETVFLDGTVETPDELSRAETIAKAIAKNVVSFLTLPRITVDQAREAITGSAAESVAAPGLDTPLTVRGVGDQILLSGTVPDQAQMEQALRSAQRTGLQVVNRLSVAAAPDANSQLSQQVVRAIGRPGIRASGSAQRLVLEGRVPDSNAAVAAVQIARAFAREVDNMLQIENPILVNVDISIVEITNSAARNLGVQFGSATLLTETTANVPPTVVP